MWFADAGSRYGRQIMPLKRHYEDPEALAGGKEGKVALMRPPKACMSHHEILLGRKGCVCMLF